MNPRRTFERLAAAAEAELRVIGSSPAVAAELEVLRLEEIHASALLAGAKLRFDEVATLVRTGRASGGHALDDYVIAADYADAALSVARMPAPSRKQPFLRVSEIVALHAQATRRTLGAQAGTWRQTAVPAFPGGMVPVPPWNIPTEIAAFAERYARAPAEHVSPLLWVAEAHERFERIHPFARGNGRVGRLLVNLLLRRSGYPPFAVRGADANAYIAALRQADTRDVWPLAAMVARSVLASTLRLSALASSDDLVELTSCALGAERDALYKAAQRGRLRTVRRGGTLLTTPAWLDAYRTSRRRRGAPKASEPAT